MGEVAVLRPQDLFSNHHHNNLISPALKSQSLGRRYSDPVPTANKHRSSSSSNSSNNRRKRSPPKKNEIKPRVTPRPRPTPTPSSDNNNNSLVMGQFKLLKRGETLMLPLSAAPPPPAPSSKDDNKVVPMMKKQQLQKSNRVPGDKKKVGALTSADGMGPPEPNLLPKQIRFVDCYAGSACVSSPPPSSLPLPAFFKKKNIVFGDVNTGTGNEDNATSDLLRLLRLDLS